ncbi:MAG: CRISPR-associated endoribonuclease Cas6 [candidate division WOR-3 bacterium]
MRFKVILKTSSKILPILYRHRIMSLFKLALEKQGLTEYYYSFKHPRPFTFSLLFKGSISKDVRKFDFGNFEIEENYFVLNSNYLNLLVSSPDYEFLAYLYNGLLELKDIELNFSKDIRYSIENVFVLKEVKFFKNVAIFKTLSPILIEDKDDNPILPSDENFEVEFNNLHRKIFNYFNVPYKDVKIKFFNYNKVVIKHTLSKFREKTGKDIMYLTCFNGIFEIQGEPKVIEFLYKKGIGNRTSQGFGMVEVVG